MVKSFYFIIVFIFLCYSCIYTGSMNSHGIPTTNFENVKCNSYLSEKYKGLYECRYYFSGIDKRGNYKDLTDVSSTPNFLDKTTYIQVYESCIARIFVNRQLGGIDNLVPDSGLMAYIESKKNRDNIVFFTVINGEGRIIKNHISIKKDTLIIEEAGSSTSGYIYTKIK